MVVLLGTTILLDWLVFILVSKEIWIFEFGSHVQYTLNIWTDFDLVWLDGEFNWANCLILNQRMKLVSIFHVESSTSLHEMKLYKMFLITNILEW